MSASTPTAINFTESLSVTRGLVSTYKDNGAGNNPDTHAEEIGAMVIDDLTSGIVERYIHQKTRSEVLELAKMKKVML